jgi:ParB family chromosome partitioning protein
MTAKDIDLSALDAFNVSNLLDAVPSEALDRAQTHGKPLMVPLEQIDEDPNQPRQAMDDKALQELVDSIQANGANGKPRGIKSPISLRPHPNQEDRFIINHDARRYL